MLEVVADIADLKSPWLSGHSRGVADLAARAVQAAGVPERDVVARYGGKTVIVGDPKNHATTELIERIRKTSPGS